MCIRDRFYSTRHLSNDTQLPRIAEVVIETMASSHPELQHNKAHIEKVLEEEEQNFSRTLNSGKQIISSKFGVLGLSATIEKESSSKNLTTSSCEKLIQAFSSKVLPDNIKTAFVEPINTALNAQTAKSKSDKLSKSELL